MFGGKDTNIVESYNIKRKCVIMEGNMRKETNRERFVRIAEARTQKIIDTIRLLGNCSNSYAYEYTQKDIEKIFSAIEAEIKVAKSKFSTNETRDNRFKL